MRQSELFTKTLRKAPKEEVSRNAQFLIRGGFIDKLTAGVYTILPLGLRVLRKIEKIIRQEMEKIDGQEVLMPALHPIENYIATKRDKIDVLFHTQTKTGQQIVLGQSHEEVVVPLVKKYIHSYRDLPLAVYQIQTKFRNELRPKSGIFRGREFIMKDLYSFHPDQQDFDRYYKKTQRAYKNIFRRVGIGAKTYLTYASGGTFSKYSHEFQTLTSAGEDTIYLCSNCKVAVNDEIIDELDYSCPQCRNKKISSQKAIEVGNIFPLKTRFTDAFNLTYLDKNGQHRQIIMGCYGIGLTRLMGAIVELNSDQNGIIWPLGIAPFQVHLITVPDKDAEQQKEIIKTADKFYDNLAESGVEVLYDDRPSITVGEKFADADLLGIPLRAVISSRTLSQKGIELKKRSAKHGKIIPLTNFIKEVKSLVRPVFTDI